MKDKRNMITEEEIENRRKNNRTKSKRRKRSGLVPRMGLIPSLCSPNNDFPMRAAVCPVRKEEEQDWIGLGLGREEVGACRTRRAGRRRPAGVLDRTEQGGGLEEGWKGLDKEGRGTRRERNDRGRKSKNWNQEEECEMDREEEEE